MKIQIDLNEILGDEYGNTETLAESVRRQVVQSILNQLEKGVDKQVREEIASVIENTVHTHVAEKMPDLVQNTLDYEYTPVSKWGDKQEPTSFRKELVKAIASDMTYKPTRYDSDKNAFTKAVDGAVEDKMKQFRKEFDAKVDEVFTAQAFQHAYAKLEEKFKISKSA